MRGSGCFAAGAASLLLAGAAVAADLPSRRAPPVYVPPQVPAFTWTGFYVGGNAGYAWSSHDTETTTSDGSAVAAGQLAAGTVPTTHRLSSDGFAGGGQVGYNYQIGSGLGGGIVVGVEADADYTDLRHTDLTGTAFNTSNLYHSRLEYLGTVRGRVGYAFDRVLVYGTGGFAYGETDDDHTYLSNTSPPFAIFSGGRSGMRTGYAIGGGIEYALPTDSVLNVFGSSAVTIRAEYLYYDLGTRTTPVPGALAALAADSLFDRQRTAGNLVRAGLNFKFGAAPAPVVARY